MVFSHLASNVLLIAMGFAPTAGLAVSLLLLRALLSQMDVPTRQAFLMLAVQDDEREATATVTNAGPHRGAGGQPGLDRLRDANGLAGRPLRPRGRAEDRVRPPALPRPAGGCGRVSARERAG